MKRFLSFTNIMDLVDQQMLPVDTVIKQVKDDTILLLKELVLKDDNSTHFGFFTEDRKLVNTIDPMSVWEIVNINIEEVKQDGDSTFGFK